MSKPTVPPRAESVDSFSNQPAIGQPESQNLTSESIKRSEGLSRRLMLAGLAVLSAGIPTVAAAKGANAELIALGKEFEHLVDAYYAARQPWARALSQRNNELDERFGADRAYPGTPEMVAAEEEIEERVGLRQVSDQLFSCHERLEPIADAINAMPCTSLEGLRSKALVAFWEVAPLCADDSEFHFDNEPTFQRLFVAVAELCRLGGSIAATGFEMPAMYSVDEDEEEA